MKILLNILEILSHIVVIFGFPIAYFQYIIAKKREKRDREYGTYNALDEKYLEFQQLCLEYPHLDIFDIPDSTPKRELNETEKKEELILFTMLFSIFERAYLLYTDQYSSIRKKQWTGWHTYIKSFCKRQNFLDAWKKSGATFDTEFESYMNNIIQNMDTH